MKVHSSPGSCLDHTGPHRILPNHDGTRRSDSTKRVRVYLSEDNTRGPE